MAQIDEAKFDELFQKLPEDLQDAIYAQANSENIQKICERNNIPQSLDFMIRGIKNIYLGVLSPNDFFAALKTELKGKNGVGQIITEINNFLLFPYKESIEKIYNLQCQPQTAPVAASPADAVAEPQAAQTPAQDTAQAQGTDQPVQ
ncbi:MAG: hypothetical protein WA093_04445, partial [Minisyncoccales bacterium]